MPTVIDYAFLFFLVVVMSAAEYFLFWPQFRAAAASGRPGARLWAYRWAVGGQLACGAATLAIWVAHSRPFAQLGLATPGGWRLAASAAIVAAIGWFATLQFRAIARTTRERRVALRSSLGEVGFLLPRTRLEHRWFIAVSLAAGVCEELIYRGYLVWILSRHVDTAVAVVAVVALFGVGHAYQGRKGCTRATLAGAVMGGIVLATGWLVPAMIVHAVIDATSGSLAYTLFREPSGSDEGLD